MPTRLRAPGRPGTAGALRAGTFDLDAELKIWLSGTSEPIERTFGNGVDVYEVQALLSTFVGR